MARNTNDTYRAAMTTAVAFAAVLGAISGLAADVLTRTPAGVGSTWREDVGTMIPIVLEAEPPPVTGLAEGGAHADRDHFNGLLLRARTSISQGQLYEAERFLRRAAEIDPEEPALFNMRKLLDIAKANIEAG